MSLTYIDEHNLERNYTNWKSSFFQDKIIILPELYFHLFPSTGQNPDLDPYNDHILIHKIKVKQSVLYRYFIITSVLINTRRILNRSYIFIILLWNRNDIFQGGTKDPYISLLARRKLMRISWTHVSNLFSRGCTSKIVRLHSKFLLLSIDKNISF